MSDTTQLTRPDARTASTAEASRAEKRLTLNPAVDVIEDVHGVTLWADLPGVERDKLEIRVRTAICVSRRPLMCRPRKRYGYSTRKLECRILHVHLLLGRSSIRRRSKRISKTVY
ncbi:hypothetical protein Bphyt_5732 [Paraburkholderia phytofirmans PsJN]|uniref:Hsp20/alpha crystallin family protein n=1 Tax=Paraburkholderia phytofirmans (strain DSM 17436 / LMG 22146 / PsJN) TaxID=398527 RepID=B2TGA2_PARPJ|nr:hypothetical protein Bphyt_5732 [Paraburkholderia phytofirmans PsJN]